MKQETLQPVDVLVCLKMSLPGNADKSFDALEQETGIGSSTLHRAVGRAQDAGLLRGNRTPFSSRLLDFLSYGVKYAFYVKVGGQTRGMPTAYAAPPLNELMTPSSNMPVWPDAHGDVRGYAVTPLHKGALTAARNDPALYELLALVDGIRVGNTRERNLSAEILEERLIGVAA